MKKKSSGLYADISITSFYGSHIINCAGNGGMVCFNNKNYYLKAKIVAFLGKAHHYMMKNRKNREQI